MRIQRVALRNFRGVVDATVELAPDGVTVVEGPNEVGKSSIAEAISLILDYPDDSKRAEVRAVRPVDADEGPEVELELVTGPYHAVYTKRWHRRGETRLTVSRPVAENHTGRAAHDRMDSIIAETLDKPLWQALRYSQGVDIAQAAIGRSLSLAAALDAAASGAALGGAVEADLWETVKSERARYFTEKSASPSAERVRLEKEVSRARTEVERLRASLDDLDATEEKHRRLVAELASMEAGVVAQRRRESELGEKLRLVEARTAEARQLELSVSESERKLAEGRTASERRQRLLDDVAAAEMELRALEEQAARETGAMEAAVEAVARAEDRLAEAQRESEAADAWMRVVSADWQHFGDRAGMEELVRRREQVERAERQRREAEEVLRGCPIDSGMLAEMEKAFLVAAEARVRLEASSPKVLVEVLGDTDVVVDGTRRRLVRGEVAEQLATTELEVCFPGVGRVTVRSGGSSSDLEASAQRATSELERQCRLAGVGESGRGALAAAREMEHRRSEAEAAARRAEAELGALLAGETPQLLAEKIERLGDAISHYEAGRNSTDPQPADLGEARVRQEQAATRVESARRSAEVLQRDLDEGRQRLVEVRTEATRRDTRTEIAEQKRSQAERELAKDREEASDEALAAVVEELAAGAAAALLAHRGAVSALGADDLDSCRMLYDNAADARKGTEKRVYETQRELDKLANELEIRGNDGLHGRLDVARSELDRVERERDRLERRAATAGLLYEAMRSHRDDARRSRRAPLREQIARLGRTVFGDSFSVELDEDLAIVNRTLSGVTVPYDSLSTGAREQLCVISRLACAALVNPGAPGSDDSGVPVIIDDALGYSDPGRLERLNAVLAVAGRHGQVIVLTCTPGRYRNVGGAKVVCLEPQSRRKASADVRIG